MVVKVDRNNLSPAFPNFCVVSVKREVVYVVTGSMVSVTGAKGVIITS